MGLGAHGVPDSTSRATSTSSSLVLSPAALCASCRGARRPAEMGARSEWGCATGALLLRRCSLQITRKLPCDRAVLVEGNGGCDDSMKLRLLPRRCHAPRADGFVGPTRMQRSTGSRVKRQRPDRSRGVVEPKIRRAQITATRRRHIHSSDGISSASSAPSPQPPALSMSRPGFPTHCPSGARPNGPPSQSVPPSWSLSRPSLQAGFSSALVGVGQPGSAGKSMSPAWSRGTRLAYAWAPEQSPVAAGRARPGRGARARALPRLGPDGRG